MLSSQHTPIPIKKILIQKKKKKMNVNRFANASVITLNSFP